MIDRTSTRGRTFEISSVPRITESIPYRLPRAAKASWVPRRTFPSLDLPEDVLLPAEFLDPGPGLGFEKDFEEDPRRVRGDIPLGTGPELADPDRPHPLQVDPGREEVETGGGRGRENGRNENDGGFSHGALLPPE